MDEKPHSSSTQLEMYWRCPESYRRRYVEGEKIPPGIAPIQGKAYHVGAETNFRQKIESWVDLPKKEIVEAAAAAFDTELAGGYILSEEEVGRGSSVIIGEAKDKLVQLAELHAEQQAPDYQPTAVEHATRILFPNATHDLLAITDLRDNKNRVTDFKTAARKMPESAVRSSTQLTIYAAAFQIDYGFPPNEVRLDVATKTKIPCRQVLTSGRGPNDFQALLNRVNSTLDAINKGCFTPCTPGNWNCSSRWCGFYATCKFVNSERRDAAERMDE